jgi:flagellar assembly protein FliH
MTQTSQDASMMMANKQAQVEIETAQGYAMQIIQEAEAAAQEMRTGAIAEIEAERERAFREGYEAGGDQARIDVEAQLAASWEQRIEALQADVSNVVTAIEAQRATLWRQTEKDIISFSIEMARKIIKAEIQENPKVIGEVIKHALRRVVNKEHIRIRISPQDLDDVRAQREDLILVLDGASNVDIVDDRRIDKGGCVIETPAGNIDAKIDTQMDRLVEALEVE